MYGRLPAGAQLSEAGLAAEFGVSRGPLREAMQRLVQEGLVRSELNRGLFVKELDEDEIRDIYLTRTAIETAAARALAHSDSAEAAAQKLRERAGVMAAAAKSGDLKALADADFAFHEELVSLAGSPRLHRVHETLMVETRMCMTALQGTYFDAEAQVAEHTRIADAVASGDDAVLQQEIQEHMQEALDRLIRADPTQPKAQ